MDWCCGGIIELEILDVIMDCCMSPRDIVIFFIGLLSCNVVGEGRRADHALALFHIGWESKRIVTTMYEWKLRGFCKTNYMLN